MADRETVKQGIRACWSKYFYHSCCDCPYMINRDDEKCVERLGTDTLELLEEQEVKTGHWIDTTNTIGFPRCECSECNSEAGAIWMKYCPNCGAKMEGR